MLFFKTKKQIQRCQGWDCLLPYSALELCFGCQVFLSSLSWLVQCEPVSPDNPSVITCLVLLRSCCIVQLLRSSFAPTLQTDLNVKLVFRWRRDASIPGERSVSSPQCEEMILCLLQFRSARLQNANQSRPFFASWLRGALLSSLCV